MDIPFVELGIALSVVILGLAVALQWTLPVAAAMALVGFFAVFHGHAHGAEMPVDSSGLTYELGFLLATAILNCAGLAVGLGVGIAAKGRLTAFSRVAGGLMAAAEPVATAVVDNTPPPSGDAPLVRLTELLRLRRRRGRCDWRRQDWRSTGGLAPWHCATSGQLEVVRATDTFSCGRIPGRATVRRDK